VNTAPKGGDADRAADGAEEGRAAGRGTQVAVVDGVLHRQHEHLHDHAEPDAEHEHVETRLDGPGRRIHPRQQVEPEGEARTAQDGEQLVATGPADHYAASHRRQQQPGHQRQQPQPGLGRRHALHPL
jgi:hypothetical protein